MSSDDVNSSRKIVSDSSICRRSKDLTSLEVVNFDRFDVAVSDDVTVFVERDGVQNTIKRDSPSHDGICVIMTRRRRCAPRLVFAHNSMLSEPAGWWNPSLMGRT